MNACDKANSQRLRHASPDDDGSYQEDFHTAEKEYDPNLTCLGCNKGFKETEIQEFRKHCFSCQLFTERVNAQAEVVKAKAENRAHSYPMKST